MLAGLDALRGRRRRRRVHARRRPTRTCTPRWSAAWSSALGAELGGKLRAGRSRNDQIATLVPDVPARPRARRSAGLVARPRSTRCVDQAERAPGRRRCRAAPTCSTRSRCCSPTTCWRTPGRWCATLERLRRLGRPRAPSSPYGSGALAGSSLGPRPGSGRRRPRLRPARSPNSIDGTASRDVVAEFAFVAAHDRRRPVPDRRGDHPLGHEGVRLRHARTTPTPPGRASCRRRRTRTSPSWRAARSGRLIGNLTGLLATLKGAAAGVQPRPAGGQGAGLRLRSTRSRSCCRRSPGMIATLTVRHRAAGGARAAGLLAGHRHRRVAGPPGRAVPRRARGRGCVRPGRARASGIELWRPHRRRARGDLAAPDARGARGAHRRGLARPRATAAAARRRVRVAEQLAELRARLG